MENLSFDKYQIKRKILRLVGASFYGYNEQGELQFYVNQKGFKLKEDIKIYTNEAMTEELVRIAARKIMDISATYDIVDSATSEKIGSLRRKGLKSILRDEWVILDTNDNAIGDLQEDSMVLALVRRLLMNLIPQTFVGTMNGTKVLTLKQNVNPFVQKISLEFAPESDKVMDKKLGIAAAVLICSIEGKQQ